MFILQIVGYKNAGKTTTAAATIAHLARIGYRVGAVKHDAHDFEPDVPGTDSWRHREAGAFITAIASASRTAWTMERPSVLDELLSAMSDEGAEAAIVEGFKTAPHPKLVLLRDESDAELLSLPNIVAVAAREPNERLREEAAKLGTPFFAIGDRRFASLLAYLVTLIPR